MSPREPVVSRSSSRGEASMDVNNNNNSNHLLLEATAAMCHHCFDTLVQELLCKYSVRRSKKLFPENYNQADFTKHLPDRNVECPLFVTWDKRVQQKSRQTDNQFELRGCIGSLSAKPIATAIGEYALLSALSDRRFQPVDFVEIPHLRVGVSLLVKYEDCVDCHDWEVGVHGIMIRWVSQGAEFTATYLPEVAQEQGWDQRAAVKSLVRKAGFRGRVDDSLLAIIQCTRYQSSKHKLTYDDYVASRGVDPVNLILSQDGEANPGDDRNGCSVM